jgi:hypothetical protein
MYFPATTALAVPMNTRINVPSSSAGYLFISAITKPHTVPAYKADVRILTQKIIQISLLAASKYIVT